MPVIIATRPLANYVFQFNDLAVVAIACPLYKPIFQSYNLPVVNVLVHLMSKCWNFTN